jgi:hypothetical protein
VHYLRTGYVRVAGIRTGADYQTERGVIVNIRYCYLILFSDFALTFGFLAIALVWTTIESWRGGTTAGVVLVQGAIAGGALLAAAIAARSIWRWRAQTVFRNDLDRWIATGRLTTMVWPCLFFGTVVLASSLVLLWHAAQAIAGLNVIRAIVLMSITAIAMSGGAATLLIGIYSRTKREG